MTQAVCPVCGGSFVMPPPKRPLECPHCAIPLARGPVTRGGSGPHRSSELAHVAVAGLPPTSRIRLVTDGDWTVIVDDILVAGITGRTLWYGARRISVGNVARLDVDERGVVVVETAGESHRVPRTVTLPRPAQRWLAHHIERAVARARR